MYSFSDIMKYRENAEICVSARRGMVFVERERERERERELHRRVARFDVRVHQRGEIPFPNIIMATVVLLRRAVCFYLPLKPVCL